MSLKDGSKLLLSADQASGNPSDGSIGHSSGWYHVGFNPNFRRMAGDSALKVSDSPVRCNAGSGRCRRQRRPGQDVPQGMIKDSTTQDAMVRTMATNDNRSRSRVPGPRVQRIGLGNDRSQFPPGCLARCGPTSLTT